MAAAASDMQRLADLDRLLAEAQQMAHGPMSPQVQQQLVALIGRARQIAAQEAQEEGTEAGTQQQGPSQQGPQQGFQQLQAGPSYRM
jgi:hypothetical protein